MSQAILQQLVARPLLWTSAGARSNWKTVLCDGSNVEMYEYEGQPGAGPYWLSGDPFISHHDFTTKEEAFRYAQNMEQKRFIDWISKHLDPSAEVTKDLWDEQANARVTLRGTLQLIINRVAMQIEKVELVNTKEHQP